MFKEVTIKNFALIDDLNLKLYSGLNIIMGETGSGKTSHVYALAQTLLEEKNDRQLEHRQMITLSASTILSSATRPGELEYIMNEHEPGCCLAKNSMPQEKTVWWRK